MSDMDDSQAPLVDHLIELRRRLLYSLVTLGLLFIICWHFSGEIFRFLAAPYVAAAGSKGELIYTKLYEAFFTQIKVSLFAAFFLSFPVIANQIWAFIAPGLYQHEKRAFLPFLLATPVLFLLGAAVAYYGALPVALPFLLGFQQQAEGFSISALPNVGDYLSFVMQFVFGFGLSFLLPILLALLERAGIVTLDQLKRGRRYAIVGAFVIAAILTPPDVISQLILAIPLGLLYELSLLVIRLTSRRNKQAS